MFSDLITITLVAGKGGDGAIAWRRKLYVPKGGPSGGNGGSGSIHLEADPQIPSLEGFPTAASSAHKMDSQEDRVLNKGNREKISS